MDKGTELNIEIKLLHKKILDAGEQLKKDGERLSAMIATRMEMLDREMNILNERTEALNSPKDNVVIE